MKQSQLVAAVTAFGRALPAFGITVSPEQVRQGLAGLTLVDIADPWDFFYTLRALLVTAPEQLTPFEAAFASFWGWPSRARQHPHGSAANQDGPAEEPLPAGAPRPGGARTQSPLPASPTNAPPDDSSGGGRVSGGALASPFQRPVTGPVGAGTFPYSPTEVRGNPPANWDLSAPESAVARSVSQIVRHLALRPGRRYRPARRGRRWDARRTIRASLSTGGVPVRLKRRERRRTKPRIVVIGDVSRSMEAYSVFALQVLHSFVRQRGRIESFIFSTALKRVTPYFRRWDLQRAVRRASLDFPYWSGGTRIGESLLAFHRDYARYLLDRNTVVVIVSDGLDTGDASQVRLAVLGRG